MKPFYSTTVESDHQLMPAAPVVGPSIGTRARVAVYDSLTAAPRVEEVGPAPATEFIGSLASKVYDLARSQGGAIPYSVVREVAENLIHADFKEPVISILDSGSTIRFADQGPGIADKQRVCLPGFTSATPPMKQHIRGVGSGLPLVKEYLSASGGRLTIEDNVGAGVVVTVSGVAAREGFPRLASPSMAAAVPSTRLPSPALDFGDSASRQPSRLSTRQKQVLALVMESGSVGPSAVSRDLGVGVSTAYRDLSSLEDMGLIVSDGGKRNLTQSGLACLEDLTNQF